MKENERLLREGGEWEGGERGEGRSKKSDDEEKRVKRSIILLVVAV